MRSNPKFLNLVLLNGEPEQKLRAARAAGFDQVEIWRDDVETNTPQLAQQLDLGFTNLQVLRDFTGTPDRERLQKREELRQFIHIAQSIGCDTIQAPATTREDCVAERIDEDLRWMASEAARYNMRIMYEPMAWCSVDNTLPLAWQRLQRLDQPNIGLVVDLFHICALGGDASQLDGIPADRIYEVQLCDMAEMPPQEKGALSDYARHQRLLPGDGIIEVERFVDKLKSGGYTGPVGIEVFNDELKAQPPEVAAQKAWQALNRYWP
ncbi:sugar phosphate isomerase/epimerase [Pantoea sp. Acro-805]|uniref:Sugar phosphate isomerase/epimerase n=1 Tax=Candidatus Pantoea formicae TaxID=2608355 RepID=A0ABX0R469_9GAMM|nr:sugar phosphate isomerase/epimerase family protein [Pantoea formicae]MDF7648548.1 sugar phosphate isomerase/epimerase [Erwiniaceae bacterium L1_54_3]NIF02760.1 sugar phosphate isomerase/epimerase [Pantoea formicae]